MISKYNAYKDSGVEWIGEIPEHWEVLRIKYFTKPVQVKSEFGSEELLSVSEHKGIVPRKSIKDETGELTRADSLVGYLKVAEGQLVCNIMLMWKRGLGVSDYDGIVSPAYSVFEFEKGDPKYFHNLFRTDIYISEFKRNSTGVIESRLRLYDDKFGVLSSHFPPLPEQTQIVSYLDEKTALIDKLISVKQRKIELLKEKRTALINQAVTKGLNSNVKMKDSGVGWIGEIPEHWGYKKTTHCFGLIGSGTTPTSNNPEYYEDGKINWLQTGDLTDGIITKTSKLITQKAFDDVNLKLYPANSLIIAMYGATIGKVGLLKIETTTNQACCVLAQPRGVFVNYIFYWFIANKDKIVSLAYGGGQPNISQETIKSLRIHCPPISEQTQIVSYLDEKTKEIDDLLNIEQKKIGLLKEYRQSLISEVVTGKIKVVNELLNEFDED